MTIEKYVAFPKDLLKILPDRGNSELALLPVANEDVPAILKSGDLAILDTADKELAENGVFAVVMAGSIVPRQTSFDGDNIVLESGGESSPPFIVKRKYISQLRIIGRIVGRIGAI